MIKSSAGMEFLSLLRNRDISIVLQSYENGAYPEMSNPSLSLQTCYSKSTLSISLTYL
jgi:hypothetical protein